MKLKKNEVTAERSDQQSRDRSALSQDKFGVRR